MVYQQVEPETAPLDQVRARPRRRRALGLGLVVVVAATLGTSWWVSSGPGREEVVERFAGALTENDATTAGALTDAGDAATAAITATRDGLGPEADVEVEVLEVGEDATFRLAMRWTLGVGRSYEYATTGRLTWVDREARVEWEPSILHPALRAAERLELRGLSPQATRVVDPAGAVLMSEQTVTAVRVDVAAPDQQIRDLVDVLALVDVDVTVDELRDAANRGEGSVVAVTLREAPLQRVGERLGRIPGVSLQPQRRMLTADGLRSPALVPSLTEGTGTAAERGWQVARVDAQGRFVEQLAGAEAGEPADVVVTLDRARQEAAQRAVDAVPGAAMLVAMRPTDGAVLAVAQNRAADREGPVALSGLYPPGSTFKAVTASAVLRAGSVAPDTVLPCPGTENVEGRQIPNDEGFDLGPVPLHTAFARSCNTTFARLGVGLAPTGLADTARDLGLGVDWSTPGLTAVTGRVPPADTPAQRVEASIGQGEVVASPFGMAVLAAGLATGTPPAPMFVAGLPATVADGGAAPAGVPEQVRDDLAAMMRETVTDGSATELGGIAGLGGKTGTAQFGDGSRSHGWFIGTLGQDVAFAVLTVDTGSSTTAVDVAATFLEGP